MKNPNSQSALAEACMMDHLARGVTTKHDLLELVETEMDLPKPTVRRVKASLKKTLQEYLKVLE